MLIRRTFDKDLIRAIVTHSSVWDKVSDDGSDKETYEPVVDDHVYWLLVIDGDVLGAYFVHPHNSVCYEIHTCLLPNAYGKKARDSAKSVLSWIFGNTMCMKVITHVPENNSLALAYAKRSGLQEEGINRASFLKNGQLMNQTLLGITKEEFTCQQQQ